MAATGILLNLRPEREDPIAGDLFALLPPEWDLSPNELAGPVAPFGHLRLRTSTPSTPTTTASAADQLTRALSSPLLTAPRSPRQSMSFCWLHSKKRATEFLVEITPGSGQFRCAPGNECKLAELHEKDKTTPSKAAAKAKPGKEGHLSPFKPPPFPATPSPGRPLGLVARGLLDGPSPIASPITEGGASPSPYLHHYTDSEGTADDARELTEAMDAFISSLHSGLTLDDPDSSPEGESEATGRRLKRSKRRRRGTAEEPPMTAAQQQQLQQQFMQQQQQQQGGASLDPQRYKTKLCKNWQLHEKCCYGPRCLFAHGYKEIRAQLSPAPAPSPTGRTSLPGPAGYAGPSDPLAVLPPSPAPYVQPVPVFAAPAAYPAVGFGPGMMAPVGVGAFVVYGQ